MSEVVINQSWPSKDPRERRAYAHAMVSQARSNPTYSDEAIKAILNAGDSRKSINSGLGAALRKLDPSGIKQILVSDSFREAITQGIMSVPDISVATHTLDKMYVSWSSKRNAPISVGEYLSSRVPHIVQAAGIELSPVSEPVRPMVDLSPAELNRVILSQTNPNDEMWYSYNLPCMTGRERRRHIWDNTEIGKEIIIDTVLHTSVVLHAMEQGKLRGSHESDEPEEWIIGYGSPVLLR